MSRKADASDEQASAEHLERMMEDAPESLRTKKGGKTQAAAGQKSDANVQKAARLAETPSIRDPIVAKQASSSNALGRSTPSGSLTDGASDSNSTQTGSANEPPGAFAPPPKKPKKPYRGGEIPNAADVGL